MKNLIFLFLFVMGIGASRAELYPAASVGYVRDVFAKTGLCQLRNSVSDSVAANMEYLMNATDICNRGITQYAKSEYASHQMANTAAVNHMSEVLYVSDGLLISLGLDNIDDWIVEQGTIEPQSNGIQFKKAVVRSREMLDLSPYQNITIEIRFKFTDPMQTFLFEHSANWNLNKCGFGSVINVSSSEYGADVIHSNANGPYVNYAIKTTDLISHTLVKTFTTIDDAHHLTFYDGVRLTNKIESKSRGDMFCSPLRNDYFYFGGRHNTVIDDNRSEIVYSVRIYNRALTAAEVCHNAWVDYRRFGGYQPDCEQ